MTETSKTVTNALRLLTRFTLEDPVLTVSVLARRLGMSRTAILRLIATLESAQMLERDESAKGYRIGIGAFELGALYLASRPLNDVLMCAVSELVGRTQCTAYLGVLDGNEVVILSCHEGTSTARFIFKAGSRLPCATTAIGKAMLMHFTPTMIDQIIGKGKDRPLGRLTKKSLRTRRELDRDLAMARRRGWALAREEAHLSLTAVGGAIRDSLGQPIAGISLSFLNQPYDQKRLTRLGMLVRATADTLSSRIVNYRSYGRSALEDVISSPMLEVNSN